MMSVAANHASTSAHDGLVLNLALRALRASHGVSSGSKDAAEQARACSDVTECSDPQLSESLSLRSSSHLQLENDLRRAPTRTQPPSSSSSQNQQMQQQLQMLLQQRLLQQQLNEPAAAENLLHPPPPPPPQQQKQQFGPASPAAAPNAALLSSLLQRLASTYASASATAVTNADFRSAAQAAPPQGAAAASGADSNAAVAAIVSKSPASPLADANAAALLHLARLVAGSAAGGSRGAGLAAQVNAVERNMANFFPSSAAPVAPPFSSVAPPSLTSIYPPPSVSGSPATSAAARSPHDSPRAATLRDLNIAAAAVAAAASGSPQVRAGAGNGVFGGAICGASFPNGGLHGGEKERDRAPLKRRFWETTGGEDGRGLVRHFPPREALGGLLGLRFIPPRRSSLEFEVRKERAIFG
ncbi:hypothetical protein CLOM_g10590 [Closterium sp. NIES-68]|nr:hypothetical protein CLOM_g10590 [Closterium sp. NIES-68]